MPGSSLCRLPSPTCRASALFGLSADERPIEIGAAVAEEAPGGAGAIDLVHVHGGHGDALFLAVEVRQDFAGVVGDEGGAVEDLPAFIADAVGGGDRRHVG